MNRQEPIDSVDQFARDAAAQLSDAHGRMLSRDEIADNCAVHGMLALLQPGEAERIESRVDRAIAAIRRDNDVRRQFWRRRIAWVGSTVGIAAAIAFAVLYVPAGSDSSAYAALESIRGSARQGGRTYSVRLDMLDSLDRDVPPSGAPRGGPAARIQNKPPFRGGELTLGEAGRWVFSVTMPGDAGRTRALCGFDGVTYWAIGMDSSVRTANSIAELRVPFFLSTLGGEAQSAADDDLELLTLDSILSKLSRGYSLSFDQSAMRQENGRRRVTIVNAARIEPGDGKHAVRGPSAVRIVADAKSFEVVRANWEWTESLGLKPSVEPSRKPLKKRVFIELIDAPHREAGWFEARAHSSSSR